MSLGRQYQIAGLLEAVALAEEELLDGLFAVSLETSLLPADEKAMTPSPANNSKDNDNYNCNYVDVAEEELLDGLFAVSLQTRLLSSEEKATTIPLAGGQSDNAIERMTELPSPAADNTVDPSVQLVDNSSSRNVLRDISSKTAEDNSCTLDITDEDEDMAEADEASCENCGCIACKDGEVDCSVLQILLSKCLLR